MFMITKSFTCTECVKIGGFTKKGFCINNPCSVIWIIELTAITKLVRRAGEELENGVAAASREFMCWRKKEKLSALKRA